MDENVQKLRVGIYTVIVFLILGILIFLNSEGWSSNYTIYLKPQSAPGVRIGTPVRKNGILIGRVAKVTTVDDHVELRLAIRESERIYKNETISIGAESVLGDAGLEVLPLAKDARGTMLENNQELVRYEVKPNPMELVQTVLELEDDVADTLTSIRTTSESIGRAGEGIETLTSQVSAVLTDEDSEIKKMVEDIRSLSKTAKDTFDDVDYILSNVITTIEDPENERRFNEFMTQLPRIFKDLGDAIANGKELIGSFGGVGEKVNLSLDDINKLTKSLGDEGPAIVTNISGGVEDIRAMIAKAEGLGDTLKSLQETFGNKNGTVGKLFNDTEAYDEVIRTLRNVTEITEEVKQLSTKLKPILNDARLFTDALARDPGILGVRGALNRRPEKTGYKGTLGGSGLLR